MPFSLYSLKREIHLMGMRLNLSLFVDCETKVGTFRLMVDGRLQTVSWAEPKWADVETPAKAEALFAKVDLDRLAEEFWMARDKAAAKAASEEAAAQRKADLESEAEAMAIAKGWVKHEDGHWRNSLYPFAKSAKASNALEDWG